MTVLLFTSYHGRRRKSIDNFQKPKRKTQTSSEVKNRWINANYKRYGVSLRYDTDGDLIEYLDQKKDSDGKGVTTVIRDALRRYIDNGD